MAKYKKCERCELNWIPVEEDLCEVCKAELGKESKIQLIDEDDENIFNERVCPICKENYLEEGEEICPKCKHEKEQLKDQEDNWEFEDDDIIDDDMEELSLNALQEEEIEEDFDDEESYNDDLDFDDGFEEIGEISDIDFDEDEDEDEEDFD